MAAARPVSPTTADSVQEARRAFGVELRALRRRAGVTGEVLARQLGWSQPKVSKIETGRTTPSDEDVRAYAGAVKATADELNGLLRRFEKMSAEVVSWRVLLQTGIADNQTRLAEVEATTTVVRHVETAIVPGLLQTAEYARIMLTDGPGSSADVAAGVQARLHRQEELYDPNKTFYFVILEDALRRQTADPATMTVQLERLAQISTLSNVHLSLVPTDVRLPIAPLHGFRIFDEQLVVIELETDEVILHNPDDITYYRRIFDQLDEVSIRGDDLRQRLAPGSQ
jgi:transcriptional regulator with XRE-family HTH domain